MSKKKKKSAENEYITSAEDYMLRYGLNNQMYAEDYIARENYKKQAAEWEKKRKAEQARQNRILSNYQMNRANPQPWVTGGRTAQLRQDAEAVRQQPEQRPTNFQDWNRFVNVMDQRSGFNQALQNRPEQERRYWDAVRAEYQAPKEENGIFKQNTVYNDGKIHEPVRQDPNYHGNTYNVQARNINPWEAEERALAYYRMNRENPQPWVNGGNAGKLRQDALQAKPVYQNQQGQGLKGQNGIYSEETIYDDGKIHEPVQQDPNYKGNIYQMRPVQDGLYSMNTKYTDGQVHEPIQQDPNYHGNTYDVTVKNIDLKAENDRVMQELMDSMRRLNRVNPDDPKSVAGAYWGQRGGMQKMMDAPAMWISDQQLEAEIPMMRKFAEGAEQKERKSGERSADETAEMQAAIDEAGRRNHIYADLNEYGLPVEQMGNGKLYVPDPSEQAWNESPNRLRQRPEEYEYDDTIRYDYDRLIYDAVHGAGAYDAAIDEAETDEEIDAIDAETEDLWNKLETRGFDEEITQAADEHYDLIRQNNGDYNSRKYRKREKELEEEKERRAEVRRIEALAPDGDGEFIPENVNYGLFAHPADQLYYYANLQLGGEGVSDFRRYGNMRPESFMTEEQLKNFNNFFNSGDKDGAIEYYNALKPYLDEIQLEFKSQLEAKMSTNGYAPIMIGNRVLTAPVAGIAGSIGTGLTLLGNEDAGKRTSGWYSLSRTNMNIQNAQAQAVGEKFNEWFGPGADRWGQLLVGTLYSMADNLTAMAMTGGAAGLNAGGMAGKLAEGTLQLIMSSEAASQNMVEKLDAGVDPTEAAISSIGTGAIEWITEKVSIEALLKPDVRELMGKPGEMIKYIAKNTIAEGSEEIASSGLGIVLDAALSTLYGHENEIVARVKELREADPNLSEEDALKQAWQETAEQTLMEGLAGAFSGLVMSGGRGALNRAGSFRSLGSNISAQGNQIDGKSGTQQLIDAAAGMTDTVSQRMAEDLQKKLGRGKNLSNYEIGQLAYNMMQDAGDQHAGIIRDTMQNRIKSELMDAGMVQDRAAEAAAAMAKSLSGEQLTDADMQAISKDERAINLWKEYNSSKSKQMEMRYEIDTASEGVRSVADLVSDLADKSGRATSAVAADVAQSIRNTGSMDEAIDDFAHRNSFMMSEQFAEKAKELLKTSKSAQASKNYLDDAMKIRISAMSLATSLPQTHLDRETAQALWNEAKAEFDEAEAQRVLNHEKLPAGKGIATFNGAEFGTDAWKQALKDTAGLSGTAKLQMTTIGELAQRMGLKVNFINDSENKYVYGWEDAGTGAITINVAGQETSGLSHHMLTTMSHEMTHWLEQNSSEGYASLRQFVVDHLRESGVDVEQRMADLIANQNAIMKGSETGELLDLNGAMAEIVAQGCEELLSSQAMRDKLQTENKSLYGRIKEYAVKFIRRLDAAIRGMENSSSREARQLRQWREDIAKIWLGAQEEAMGRAAGGTTKDGKIQMSVAMRNASLTDVKESYETAIRNGNDAAAREALDAYAAKQGYTDRAYHGTSHFGFTKIDIDQGDGTFFVAYNPELASTYTKTGDVKNITDRELSTMSGKELAKYVQGISEESGEGIEGIRYNPATKDFSVTHTDEDGNSVTETYSREDLEGMVEGYREYDESLPEGERSRALKATQEGIYDLYTRPGKQLVVDAKGSSWRAIPFHLEDYGSSWEAEYGSMPEPSGWKTRDIAAWAKANGYDSVRINNVYDNGMRREGAKGFGDIGIFFDGNDVKSADLITQDDNGKEIGIGDRFNDKQADIRYSVAQAEEVKNSDGEQIVQALPGGTVTKFSLRSWNEDNQELIFKKLTAAGHDPVRVRKWIHDVDSVAAMIAADRDRLDYKADRSHKFKKPNADVYRYTLDASTLCAKRLLYQGTFNRIQAALPNTPLRPGDLIELANMMHEMGYQTPCGICYVESKRRHTGNAAEQFLSKYDGEYIPNYAELTTTDGLARLKEEHPQAYKDFIKAMNRRGSGSVKLVQQRTDYRKDLRRMSNEMVGYLNSVGGIRVQSFSDFETPHMIDMMQACLDMAAKGLKSQGYTKVPNFAWVFGDTGIKINLSLMGDGTGVDADGNLVFSNTEGMDFDEAMKLRDRYSKNVGTILVGMNNAHIIAAMGDSRIDFIIPFHKSGWSQEELSRMKTLENYDNFEAYQNERKILSRKADGTYETEAVKGNILPEEYWDYSLTGRENAEKYLQICAERGLQPKFYNFLTDNGDGTYSMPAGDDRDSTNIREGYWKTLIDFKMYDNDGVGAPQQEVKPTFNMQEATRVLNEYEGGANTLPTADPVVERYVREYKEKHPERKVFSVARPDMDVISFMEGLNENNMATAQEKTMVRQFKELRAAMDLARHALDDRTQRLRALEAKQNPSAFDRSEMQRMRILVQNSADKLDRLEKDMIRATGDKGYAKMMSQQSAVMDNLVSGRTADAVRQTVEALTKDVEALTRDMDERQKKINILRMDLSFRERAALVDMKQAENVAGLIRKEYGSSINKRDLVKGIAEIRLMIAAGQNIDEAAEELAWKIAAKTKGEGSVYLDMLRGKTIVIGPGAMKELKGQNSSLKEVRSALAGTGIKVKTGTTGTLGSEWSELCDMIPSLNRDTGEKDQLDEFLRLIRSEKASLTGETMYEGHIAEVAEDLKGWIASVGTTTGTKQDPEAVKLRAQMNEMNTQQLAEVRKQMAQLLKDGRLAMQMTAGMQKDVEKSIEYNNLLAEQSEAAIWKQEKWKLKEQLQNEKTQALLAEQAKWKERIEKDKRARDMMQTNMQLRKAIHTNVSRIRKLLINETDLKNIPEHMKGLAREMLGMIVTNDITGRKITGIAAQDLLETNRILGEMTKQDGEFNPDDLRLITDEEAQSVVMDALADLEDGIAFYNASTGGGILANLQAFHNALDRIADAVTTIVNVIHAEQSINIGDRKIAIADAAEEIAQDMNRSRFKGELQGAGSKQLRSAKRAVVTGNETPVYFFKNLRNRGMMQQWQEMKRGENRNGLELQKAQDFMRGLAEETNYKAWADEKHTVKIGSRNVEMTVGNMMELYAIWRREKESNPQMSNHLANGGVFIQSEDRSSGLLRRETQEQRPVKVTDEDVQGMYAMLTPEQKTYLDKVVGYLSSDMSDLGNEASMRMYGIKKYKEKWYFPMKVWDGVKSARSDRGISGSNENRAAHKGWSKRRIHRASNALVIGDFTQDAVSHIVEMINYNTMAPAIENMNKILNYQRTEANEEGDPYSGAVKRNIRVMFQQAYGKDALNYLETFLQDLNGGMVQDQRSSLRDKALTMFKKNAVAGSMSVALQQPLSYIRAGMMINPKYLAAAISPAMWKGSYAEMNRYSGVAVIKDMGRFDMQMGASAKEYVAPEKKQTAYGWISDKLTALPEMMDRMTWTRMWSAVKLEQHAKNPQADMKSEEFLKKCAERFNDVMQATQVYDSVMVKSSNMRSSKTSMKVLTSFMAEPTVTLNVLADAVRNVNEKGGKLNLAKAGVTFVLSAVLQAAVKGAMGSGRTPEEKKTWLENFLYKFEQNLMGEMDVLNLVPGASDLVELIRNGKLSDDSMTVLGKIGSSFEKLWGIAENGNWNDYRSWEDSVGQLAQLFTNLPLKNLMRDGRAMYNWITQEPYVARETSGAVLRQQAKAAFWTADNLIGAVNARLKDAGYQTTNKAYYGRLYNEIQNGNEAEAEDIREYLTLIKGQDEKKIASGLKSQAYAKLDPAEASQWAIDQGLMENSSTLTTQYKEGEISRDEYTGMMKQLDPNMSDDDLWWKVDRIDFQKETGESVSNSYSYRLKAAIGNNSAEEIRKAVKDMKDHGRTQKQILDATSDWKKAYLEADADGRRRIRDAIQKVYKAAGSTAEEADKKINKWK